MKSRIKAKSFITLLLIIIFICYSQVALSSELSIKILGTAVGAKEAKVSNSFGTWMSIDDRSHPIMSGLSMKTGNGNISIHMKDNTVMTVGKDTEITISGTKGEYSITLQKGIVIFRVPAGSGFFVSTPTASISVPSLLGTLQKASFTMKTERRGIIYFDGKGTRVRSYDGNFNVQGVAGSELHKLSRGGEVYLTLNPDDPKLRMVQLADDDKKDDDKDKKGALIATGGQDSSGLWKGMAVVGGAVGAVFAGAAILEPPKRSRVLLASPYRP